ncbi:MAG: four helix bundle protein [Candidatus Levybacteria bacterium]|nr:four helix bundle protein [Candidatus Levybacteria bacterium]
MNKFSNNNSNNKKYDLEERTAEFGEKVIELCKKAPKNAVTIPIIDQLIRSGTSIGANYCEANGASSRKDFNNKIFICKKESKETKYWLRLLAKAVEELKEECRKLWQEAQEFTLIFSKIAKSTKG